jgi:hypothetical protein
MKQRIFRIIVLLIFFQNGFAQTGIGTTTPDASAKLDVTATNKGFLPPRVTLTSGTDNTTIPNPATGLLIYNTGTNVGLAAGYYFWNGNAWATIATAGGSGSFAASYMRGSRTASQSMTVNDAVTFSSIDNTAGQDISLNTTSGKITLTAGNTYRLIGAVPGFSGSRPSFSWYNETTGAYIGSAANAYGPSDAAGNGASGGIAEVILKPNVNTVVYLKLASVLNSTSTGSITTGNGDFLGGSGYPWFEAQVISGNAPVTGQSVDYVSVMLTTDQSNSIAGQNVKFQTIQSGNIPYDTSTGNFSLTAGKTYMLSALASLNGTSPAGSALDIIWRTADGVNIGPYGSLISANTNINFSGQGVVDYIYTPSRNTTVSLYISYVGNSTTVLRSYSTNATITQIGSSAIVNPWTLSGTNTYNTTGNVGIGTSSPSASALLDLTSTSQGLLPPRLPLTAKSGTSSPIASPTTGLIVYNTASAGTGVDAVTPGYYYFNGTIWTRMDPEGWSTSVPITIGATITAPTKGPTSIDYVKYRNIVGKEYEMEYNYLQTSAGSGGNGDYLISLPSGLQFDFTYPGQVAYTGAEGYDAIKNRITSSTGDILLPGYHNSITIVPYNATQFRVHLNNWGSLGWYFFRYGAYTMSSSNGFKINFRIKVL